LRRYYDHNIGTPCDCGTGIREVRCANCKAYKLSCRTCYVNTHRNEPFHWALLWDKKEGFFARCDRSVLNVPGSTLQLGHHGHSCPRPASDHDLLFTVVDDNGVHGTRIRFCACDGLINVDKADQLLDADLFPSTMTDPKSAFTFDVLNRYQKHHFQSKCSAYDFYGALQRLTDNVFTHQVPVK
jgi:hypothetical protein